MTVCTLCDGRGRQYDPKTSIFHKCVTCNGTGEIPNRILKDYPNRGKK